MQTKNYEKIELLKDPSTGVNIKVKDPIMEAGGSFTSYMVVGTDKLGSFEMRRRFNEFFLLRQALSKSWPGLYIPPIPEKKITGNKEDKLIDDRKKFLEQFCQQVSKISYLYYCEVFQQFIRNKSVMLETINDQLSKQSVSQKLALIKQLFGQSLTGKQPIHDLKSRISHFNAFLRKSQKELETLKDRSKQIAYSVRVFNNNFNICTNLIVPEYEKNIFKQYVDEEMKQLPFLHNDILNEKIRLFRDQSEVNPLEYLVDYLTFEHRQTIALQEAIQAKQELQSKKRKLQEKRTSQQSELSKLLSGKTTFKSFFSKGNKNQQITVLQKSVSEDAKEIESLDVLLNIVTVVLSRQITNYKDEKQNQYINLLRRVSVQQIQKQTVYGDLIRTIATARQAINIQE